MILKNDKILITGGHLTCALSVLEELKSQEYTNIVWVGTKYSQTDSKNLSAEYTIINNQGIKFIDFKAGKLWRKVTLKTFFKALVNLFLIPLGFFNAIRIISKENPKVVLSFGGFLALPIVIAAKMANKKIITHEQTLTVGLANKIISKYAEKILISFESSAKYFPSNKTILTGLPLRKDIFISKTNKFKFNNLKPIIYITGGNQGANTINWRIFKVLPQLLIHANVIHQVGGSTITKDIDMARKVDNELPNDLKDSYVFFENAYDEIGEIYSLSNIILSRAGANTIYEILSLGKLSVLIPIPWSSNNEQLKNAQLVAKTGLGFVLKQYDEMPPQELYQSLMMALEVWSKESDFKGRNIIEAVNDAKRITFKDAASKIVNEITK